MLEIEELKKEYLKTPVPNHLSQDGWFDLESKLTPKHKLVFQPIFARPLVFASVMLLIFTGLLLKVAQTAQPGNALYPVKILSDNIIAKITGHQEIKIEKRVQEIIDLSSGPQKNLDEAAKQYQKALDETKEEAEKSGKQQKFRQTLEEQEQKLKQAQQKNPSSKLEEVIKNTEEIKGQVHGQKDQKTQDNKDNQNNSNQNRQNQNNQNRGPEQSPNRRPSK